MTALLAACRAEFEALAAECAGTPEGDRFAGLAGRLRAAERPEPAGWEEDWLRRVGDWYRAAHSGLDCAGAPEAGHFDRAGFTSVSAAIYDLLCTAIWLGMGNRTMVEEIRDLLTMLATPAPARPASAAEVEAAVREALPCVCVVGLRGLDREHDDACPAASVPAVLSALARYELAASVEAARLRHVLACIEERAGQPRFRDRDGGGPLAWIKKEARGQLAAPRPDPLPALEETLRDLEDSARRDGVSVDSGVMARDIARRLRADLGLPETPITNGQRDIPDSRLVEGAVRNAGLRASPRRPRWAAVRGALGVGSTSATRLCRRFGLDPDEEVGLHPEDEEEGET